MPLVFMWKCFGVCTAVCAVFFELCYTLLTYVITAIWQPDTTNCIASDTQPHVGCVRSR